MITAFRRRKKRVLWNFACPEEKTLAFNDPAWQNVYGLSG